MRRQSATPDKQARQALLLLVFAASGRDLVQHCFVDHH
jgi:hypothetical protein